MLEQGTRVGENDSPRVVEPLVELDRPSSGLSLKIGGDASKTKGWHGVNWDYQVSYRLYYKD